MRFCMRFFVSQYFFMRDLSHFVNFTKITFDSNDVLVNEPDRLHKCIRTSVRFRNLNWLVCKNLSVGLNSAKNVVWYARRTHTLSYVDSWLAPATGVAICRFNSDVMIPQFIDCFVSAWGGAYLKFPKSCGSLQAN